MKDSFIFYTEYREAVECMTDQQAGMLLKSLIEYSDGGEPEISDPSVKMVFLTIKPRLDRDRDKWEQTVAARSEAGKKGGAPKGNNNAAKTSKNKQNKQKQTKQTKQADSDSVTDSVNTPLLSPLKGWRAKKYSDNPDLDKAIHDYIEHRKSMKSPFTDRAFELAMKKLDALANTDQDKIAILNQSIEQGWKGLFALNGRASPNVSEGMNDKQAQLQYARTKAQLEEYAREGTAPKFKGGLAAEMLRRKSG